MIRSVLAVVAGVVTWIVVVTALNVGLRLALPGYAGAEPTMAFTLPMLIGRLVIALVTSVVAGYACGWVARDGRQAGWVFAALMVVLFVPLHLKLWHAFPPWYHLVFLLTLAPALLTGVALQRRWAPRG